MIKILPFNETYLDEIAKLELMCFSIPWTREMFEEELKSKLAYYFVAIRDEKLIGYAGMWKILDEGHITNIAVSPYHRRLGIGRLLIEKLIETANQFEINIMMLEVRRSNIPAQNLYGKYGFKEVGIRKNYYTDTKEDAILMNLLLQKEE